MTIGVLALVSLSPERIAALTAAGYAVREGNKSVNRMDAVREAGDSVRAVLTNGRGGFERRRDGIASEGGAGTKHLVNADVLTALGPKGYLVNVGRGTVVDTAALIDALRSKRIAGAGLDVLEGEPSVPPLLPELLGFDNVVITPHCAGRAPEARAAATALVLVNLNAHFAGKPLPHPVARG